MANFFESNNPVLNEKKLKQSSTGPISYEETMTVSGAVNKTIFLFFLMMITTAVSFVMPSNFLLITGAVGGLIAVLVSAFKPQWSATLAPGYALFEGLFLGTITAIYGGAFGGGIIFQAICLTFGTLFMMLMIYKSGLIKVTSKFRTGVMMATGAVFIMYMVSWIGGMFFNFEVPYLHEGGLMGIGISVVIIGIAALNLLLDFDMFEKGEEFQAPIYMEWFAAMGLLVTLVWLYVEFLRLLSKLNRD